MRTGRPTKLTKELIAKAREYEKNWAMIDGAPVPTKEGLALYLGVNRSSLYEWDSLDTPLAREFSDIFEKIMAKQGRTLVANGLNGKFNPAITKMMLTKHDYIERTEVDQNVKGNVTFINDVPRPTKGGDA